jgi:hypothetical protein
MATTEQIIGEVDVVAFERPIKKVDGGLGNWPTGTMGTVVSDYGDHKEIEIVNELGETLDLVIVPVEQLKLVKKYS